MSLWLSYVLVCVLKGEDGEAGDPGAVGLPGRIVSVFCSIMGGRVMIL